MQNITKLSYPLQIVIASWLYWNTLGIGHSPWVPHREVLQKGERTRVINWMTVLILSSVQNELNNQNNVCDDEKRECGADNHDQNCIRIHLPLS